MTKIDWDIDVLTGPIHAPFQLHAAEDFDEYAVNASITLDELIAKKEPNHIGINLVRLKNRLLEYEIELSDIDNFILLVADIEDVLQFTF